MLAFLLILLYSENILSSDDWLSYDKVHEIINNKCIVCHNQKGKAAFLDLTDPQTVIKSHKSISDSVLSGLMPPWLPEPGYQEYKQDYSLTKKEKEVLVKWSKNPTLKRNRKLVPSIRPSVLPVEESLSSFEFRVPDGMIPKKKKTDYRCFTVDWKRSKDVYIKKAQTMWSTPQAHHIELWIGDPDEVRKAKIKEGSSGLPGLDCYAEETRHLFRKARLIMSSGVVNFPEGSGTLVRKSEQVFIVVHYDTFHISEPYVDRSSFKVWFTEKKPRKLGEMRNISGFFQHGRVNVIPANAKDYVVKFTEGFSTKKKDVDLYFPFTHKPPLFLYGAHPHMHYYLGKRVELKILRKGGGETVLVKINKWLHSGEQFFWFKRPIKIYPGDKIELTCVYDNSESNPKRPLVDGKSIPVPLYLGKEDEMCSSMLYTSKE